MIATETYQIKPEWGSLAMPLLRRMESGNGVDKSHFLESLRQIGMAQFQNVPVPTRKTEDWKYTPLRTIVNLQYAEAAVPDGDLGYVQAYKSDLQAITFVFINGHFIPGMSDSLPEGLWMGTLEEAAADGQKLKQLESIIPCLESSQMTPFEALATGAVSNGYCLIVSPEIQLKQPVHFLYVNDHRNSEPAYLYPYKIIMVGRHAQLDIVESWMGHRASRVTLTNAVSHIYVDRSARLRHYRLQLENLESFHINATRVFQERDSSYTSFATELGSRLTRNNIEVIHRDAQIDSHLFGVYMGEDHQHLDTQSFVDHAYPNCTSNELYKGILDDSARGVFNGKILVRPDAQKTNAFQQNATLVLSHNAVADSKPQLEIFADDVRCSHGATIGQLDAEAVFYLRSRGLTKMEASAMLQDAFLGEVLDHCPDEAIRNYLTAHVTIRHHG